MLLDAVANLDRLRQITQVLARHGFGEILARTDLKALVPHRSNPPGDAPPPISLAERVRRAFEELGPAFVKLGQILSTRPDLLPAELIVELKKLQESVPPVPFAEVRAILEESS